MLNLLWRQSVKSCFNKTWMYQSCVAHVRCTAHPETEMKMQKTSFCTGRISAEENRTRSGDWDINWDRAVYADSIDFVRSKKGGATTGKRRHNFSLNPGRSCMKCQGKEKKNKWNVLCYFSTKRKGTFKEFRDLGSTTFFATRLVRRLRYLPPLAVTTKG